MPIFFPFRRQSTPAAGDLSRISPALPSKEEILKKIEADVKILFGGISFLRSEFAQGCQDDENQKNELRYFLVEVGRILDTLSSERVLSRPTKNKDLSFFISSQIGYLGQRFSAIHSLLPAQIIKLKNHLEFFAGLPLSNQTTLVSSSAFVVVPQTEEQERSDMLVTFVTAITNYLAIDQIDHIQVLPSEKHKCFEQMLWNYVQYLHSDTTISSKERCNLKAEMIADYVGIFTTCNESYKALVEDAFQKFDSFILKLMASRKTEEYIGGEVSKIIKDVKIQVDRSLKGRAKSIDARILVIDAEAIPLPPSPTASSGSGASRRSLPSSRSTSPAFPIEVEQSQEEFVQSVLEGAETDSEQIIFFAQRIKDKDETLELEAIRDFAKALAIRPIQGAETAYLYFTQAIMNGAVIDEHIILNFARAFSEENTTGQIVRKQGLVKLFIAAMEKCLETPGLGSELLFKEALIKATKLLESEKKKQNVKRDEDFAKKVLSGSITDAERIISFSEKIKNGEVDSEVAVGIFAQALAEKNISEIDQAYLHFIEAIFYNKVTNYTFILKFAESFSEGNALLNRPVIRTPEVLIPFIPAMQKFIADKSKLQGLQGQEMLQRRTLERFESAVLQARKTLELVNKRADLVEKAKQGRVQIIVKEALDRNSISVDFNTKKPQQIELAHSIKMGSNSDADAIENLAWELGVGASQTSEINVKAYEYFSDAIVNGKVQDWDAILTFAQAFFEKKEIFNNPYVTLKFMSFLIKKMNDPEFKTHIDKDFIRSKAIVTLQDSIVNYAKKISNTGYVRSNILNEFADLLANQISFPVSDAYAYFMDGIEKGIVGDINDLNPILKFSETFLDKVGRVKNPVVFYSNVLERFIEQIKKLKTHKTHDPSAQKTTMDRLDTLLKNLEAQKTQNEQLVHVKTEKANRIQAHFQAIRDTRNSRARKILEDNLQKAVDFETKIQSERRKAFFVTEDLFTLAVEENSHFYQILATPLPKKPWWQRARETVSGWFGRTVAV